MYFTNLYIFFLLQQFLFILSIFTTYVQTNPEVKYEVQSFT